MNGPENGGERFSTSHGGESSGKGAGRDTETSEFDALLTRMRAGNREAAAEFVTRYGARVRRRIRGKLSQSMRRLFDSQELMSTVARRLDAFVRSGRLAAVSEGQLWSLVFRIAEHALADKGRVFKRLQTAEAEDGPFASGLLDRMRRAEHERQDGAEIELDGAFQLLGDPTDRTILSLWLADTPHNVTADYVGLSPAAVRQRWHSIRLRLRSALAPEVV